MSEQIQKKGWFSRNWLWFVPVSGCLLLIVLFVFGIGAAFFGVSKILTGSEPYQYAIEKTKSNEKVLQILGEPIETNGMMNGNISTSGSDGEANFKIPIKGSKGEARIIVVAEKDYGEWKYEELYVQIRETKEKINLLEKSLEGF